MNKIFLLSFIVVIIISCATGEKTGLSASKSIMIQNQYREVGFESPDILYNSDSSYVIVKKTLSGEKLSARLINYFVFKLSTNQIVFQEKFFGEYIKWISKDEIEVKCFDNKNLKNEKIYRINFKTNSRENIRLTSD